MNSLTPKTTGWKPPIMPGELTDNDKQLLEALGFFDHPSELAYAEKALIQRLSTLIQLAIRYGSPEIRSKVAAVLDADLGVLRSIATKELVEATRSNRSTSR